MNRIEEKWEKMFTHSFVHFEFVIRRVYTDHEMCSDSERQNVHNIYTRNTINIHHQNLNAFQIHVYANRCYGTFDCHIIKPKRNQRLISSPLNMLILTSFWPFNHVCLI